MVRSGDAPQFNLGSHQEQTGNVKQWCTPLSFKHRTSRLACAYRTPIQPTILEHKDGKLQILVRTQENRIYTSWSDDMGLTWTELVPTNLPNNNSGIDAVTLDDGRFLLVYNHIDRSVSEDRRNRLHVAVSGDGINWSAVVALEDDDDPVHEYSYPAVIQSRDGTVHITYTWRRELIKHVELDPSAIEPVAVIDRSWPL